MRKLEKARVKGTYTQIFSTIFSLKQNDKNISVGGNCQIFKNLGTLNFVGFFF